MSKVLAGNAVKPRRTESVQTKFSKFMLSLATLKY